MTKATSANYALLGGIGLIWGSQFVLNEIALESMPPLTVAAGRIALGLVTLALILQLSPKPAAAPAPAQQPWGLYAAIALAEAVVPSFLIVWGQQRVDSSIAAILMATIPFFTLVLSTSVTRDEPWSVRAVVSVVLGFAGVVILLGPDADGGGLPGLLGELAILGAALSFAISLVLVRRVRGIPARLAMRNVFLLAAPPMVVLAAAIDRPWTLEITTAGALAVLGLGTFCGGVVYLMLAVLIARAGATFASLSNYLVILVGVFVGILALGDELGRSDMIALIVIVAALVLSQWRELLAGFRPQSSLAA